MQRLLGLRLLKLRDELRPADVSCAQVLVIQSREANVHQNLAQAVVHCVQHQALSDRAVSRRGASRLQQLSGAAAPEVIHGRVWRSRRPGGGGSEQLSGGAEQGPVFKGSAVEAEGGVVVPRCDGRTTWCANGAEVQKVVAPLAHRGHFPQLGKDIGWGLAGRGRGQVAAAFYGGLEGELPVGAVLLLLGVIQLRVSHVLESWHIGGDARVKESVIRAEEHWLLVRGVNQALFTSRAAGLSLRKGFRSWAFNWNTSWLLLHPRLDVWTLLRIHHHCWDVTLGHLWDIQRCALKIYQ